MNTERNPYRPPSSADEGFVRSEAQDSRFRSNTSGLTLCVAIWIACVCCISYNPNTNASDGFSVAVFFSAIGLIFAKWIGGGRIRTVLIWIGTGLILAVFVFVRLSIRRGQFLSFDPTLLAIMALLVGCCVAITILAYVLSLAGHVFVRVEELAREFGTSKVPNRIAWAAVRLSVAFIPIQLLHILEIGTIGVRKHWFHDFLFIDPWLWLIAPVGLLVTTWAFMPFLPASTRFFFRLLWIVLLCTFAVVLVLAAMPLTSVVSVVIDSESSPASRWLSLNILIASAWLFHNAFDTYQRIACSSGESG